MSPIPLRKKRKKTNKDTTKKQAKKQTKQKTKTENTHTLTLRNLPKHCDVCRIIFYHVVTVFWRVAVKNVTTRCCNVTLFLLDSTSRLVATFHVISCLCWHSGMYRVTYLHLVLPVFVCIQKRSSFLKPRVSSESVPLNDFKSYNRTSNIWKHHSPL